MTGFIKEMRECLIKEGLLVSMQDLDENPLEQAGGPDDQGQEGEVDLVGPTWVDDHAIFTVTRDPNVHNIRTIMVTLEAVAARHGFCLNTEKGKTGLCVITFAGKGIMAAKRALDWQEDHAQLQYGDQGILRLVDSYKHLGTLHDQYVCRSPELVRRAKTARTAVGAISRRVLRNTKLSISVRRQASVACIDGALFLGGRMVVGTDATRAPYSQRSQVSDASCSGECQVWAGRSNKCRTPKATQGTLHFACLAGSSIAISTTPASPCSALSTFPSPTPLCGSMETDHDKGSL